MNRIALMRRELHEQFKASAKGKMPWSTKAFVRTVREIEHHDVVNSGVYAAEFECKEPRDWTCGAIDTLETAAEAYLVQVRCIPYQWQLPC